MTSRANRRRSPARDREHREHLRSQGMRLLEIWVPNVRSPEFRSEAHRQSLAVATSSRSRDDQAFIDLITTPSGHAVDNE